MLTTEVVGNGAVVTRRHIENFRSQPAPEFDRGGACMLRHFAQNFRVIARIADHGDRLVVLRRAAQHGGSADIDVFDRFPSRHAVAGNCLFESVKIHHDEINGGDTVRGGLRDVLRKITTKEQTAVDQGMQCLHPPVEHLGKSGVCGNVGHGKAGLAQRRRRAAGGQNFHTVPGQAAGKVNKPGFVGHGKKGTAYFHQDPIISAREPAASPGVH